MAGVLFCFNQCTVLSSCSFTPPLTFFPSALRLCRSLRNSWKQNFHILLNVSRGFILNSRSPLWIATIHTLFEFSDYWILIDTSVILSALFITVVLSEMHFNDLRQVPLATHPWTSVSTASTTAEQLWDCTSVVNGKMENKQKQAEIYS